MSNIDPELTHLSIVGKNEFSQASIGRSREFVADKPCVASHQDLSDRILSQSPELLEASMEIAEAVSKLEPCEGCEGTRPRALIIGGFVRDAALGLEPKDLDLEVYGISAEQLLSVLEELFPNRINSCGKSFEVLKVQVADGLDIDVSLPRIEVSTGPKTTDFEVTAAPELSVYEAAKRRDFTINTVSFDQITKTVFDEHQGLQHLAEKKLVVTNTKQFQEDPLRVYRAVQFCARMDLAIEPKSEQLIRKMIDSGALENLPAERVQEEFSKLFLKSEKPSIGIELMRDLGILTKYFPEIQALWDTPQDPLWHPEGDVGIHTMLVVDAAAQLVHNSHCELDNDEKLTVILGALCHDLGKPLTTKFDAEKGRIRSLGHDVQGVKPTLDFLKKLKYANKKQSAVAAITKFHMKPRSEFQKLENKSVDYRSFINNTRKLMKAAKAVDFELLLTVCEADSRGRTTPGASTDVYETGQMMRSAIALFGLTADNLIEGKDLLELGLEVGEKFGRIIREVEARRDKGKVWDKKQALSIVRENNLIRGRDFSDLGIHSDTVISTAMVDLKKRIRQGEISTRNDALSYLKSSY